MAAFVVVAIIMTVLTGIVLGAFIGLSRAISWEDRRRGSLRLDAPNSSTRVARSVVNVSDSGWH